jgi:lysophospholipase L1-like esterase
LAAVLLLGLGATAPSRRIVLFLGDSITAGYGLELSQAYPALISRSSTRVKAAIPAPAA